MKAFLLLMLFSLPLTVVDAQTKQDNWQNLLRMNQQFENYNSDFVEFGKFQHAARSRNSED